MQNNKPIQPKKPKPKVLILVCLALATVIIFAVFVADLLSRKNVAVPAQNTSTDKELTEDLPEDSLYRIITENRQSKDEITVTVFTKATDNSTLIKINDELTVKYKDYRRLAISYFDSVSIATNLSNKSELTKEQSEEKQNAMTAAMIKNTSMNINQLFKSRQPQEILKRY